MGTAWVSEFAVYAGTCISAKHKPYFANVAKRDAWFSSRELKRFTGLAPVYPSRGVEVNCEVEDIAAGDYCSWTNPNFGRRVYYGVITNKSFINSNNTLVTFELDAWVTYMRDVSFNPCYVVREHVEGDWEDWNNPGQPGNMPSFNNLIADSVPVGDFEAREIVTKSFPCDSYQMYATTRPNGDPPQATIENGVLNILYHFESYPSGSESPAVVANRMINTLNAFQNAGRIEAVISVKQVPKAVCSQPSPSPIDDWEIPVPRASSLFGFGDNQAPYVPQNAKLYTAPYSQLLVNTPTGDNMLYKWELFGKQNRGNALFSFKAIPGFDCEIYGWPRNYERSANQYAEGLTLADFPEVPWGSNYYTTWAAQNNAARTAKVIMSFASIYAGNPAAAFTGLLDFAIQQEDKKAIPNSLQGKYVPNNPVVTDRVRFDGRIWQIKRENAIAIDSEWTAHGYPVLEVKQPNLRTRPYWNYVQLRDPAICGGIPAAAKQDITEMVTAGVTFWHVDRGADIGDYEMDNRNSYGDPQDPDPKPPIPPDPPDPPEVDDMQFPFVGGWGTYRVTSEFGPRDYPPDPFHTGIDFSMPTGTQILAAQTGTVSRVVRGTTGYGYYIIIDHADNLQTLYGHNSRLDVAVGQTVEAGAPIALSGNTGLSTGPHLHFEVRKGGSPVNPRLYLPK